ncbi:UNVERIFIED_CONTAM: DNA-binding protein BIN4 [Sesamum radiatum]|uniref:DNA-binding protein BIN4 n=1 Tax=Sesamum radiatum TaxID=300843 RepID=A0AAW2JZR6_SESRA
MDVFTMLKLPSLFVCSEPPTQSAIELSSGSESPLDGSPAISDDDDAINLSKLFKKEAKQASDTNHKDYMTVAVVNKPVEGKSPKENDKVKPKPERKRQNEDESEREDSESSPDTQPCDEASKGELSANEEDLATKNVREMDNILLDHDGEPPMNRVSKVKSPMKKLEKEDEKTSKKKDTNISINGGNHVKEDSSRKHPGLQALVECEGDSIDLSGTIYKTTIVPSRTFCVIEAIMNDYIQLKPQSNVYEAETMVEGTLDGFSFDSEDENDKSITQVDQHEAAEEQPDGKSKRKPDKTSVRQGKRESLQVESRPRK